MRIANKDKIVFLPKQFILRHFQFENCVFRSESVAKSDKLSYNKKRKRGIFLLLFWRRSSKVRIGVYFMKEKEKTKEPDRIDNQAPDCLGNIHGWISKSDTGS